MINPMTTAGDTIYGGVSGAPTRLGQPGNGLWAYTFASSVPSWTQLGTAATVNTGTSGGTLGLLNANLTFSGSNAYGTPASLTLSNATGLPPGGIASQSNATFIANVSGSAAVPTAASLPTTANALWKGNANGQPAASSLTDNGTNVTGTEPLLVSNIIDGEAPVTITTGASASLGGTYNSGYTFNQEGTANTAVTYTLPTPAAGKQYCVKNSNNGSAADTGTLEIIVANTGTQSIIYNGTKSSSGYIISGGAAGDSACVVGISSTQWEAYAQVGTWTLH